MEKNLQNNKKKTLKKMTKIIFFLKKKNNYSFKEKIIYSNKLKNFFIEN
ncbi:DUF4295 domain-containing protein [Candidatus Karelsulcia muelleri]|nr:DUF4295 domain-containing protein [Candidatus Karelsulcia muelleri]